MSELLYDISDHWLVLRGDGGGDGGGGDGGGDSGDAGGASGGDSGGDTGGAPSSDSGVAPDGSPDAAPSQAADLSPDVTADTSAQDQGLAPGSFATQGITGDAATDGPGFGGGFGTGAGGFGGPSIDAFDASTGPSAVANSTGAPAVSGGFSSVSDALSTGSDDALSEAMSNAPGLHGSDALQGGTGSFDQGAFDGNSPTTFGAPSTQVANAFNDMSMSTPGSNPGFMNSTTAEGLSPGQVSGLMDGIFGPPEPGLNPGVVSINEPGYEGPGFSKGSGDESLSPSSASGFGKGGGDETVSGGGNMPSVLGPGADQQNINDFLNTFGGNPGSQQPGSGITSTPGAGGTSGGLSGDEFAGGTSFGGGGGGGPRISGNAGTTGGIQLAGGDVLSADALAAGPSLAGDALAPDGGPVGGSLQNGGGTIGGGTIGGIGTVGGAGGDVLGPSGILGFGDVQQQQANSIATALVNQARQLIFNTYGVAPETLPQWPAILSAIQQQAQNQVLTGTLAVQPLRQ